MTLSSFLPLESLKELNFDGNNIKYQLSPAELVQKSVTKKQGAISDTGALVIHTGKFTGRSPKDKFIVFEETIKDKIDWNEFNNPIDAKYFDSILNQAVTFLNARDEIYVRDAYACADPKYKISIRIISQLASTDLFAFNMLLSPDANDRKAINPDWHIIVAPGMELDPLKSGTRQGNATVISFSKKIIVIVGSGYTGEIKKSIFTILNYLLPVDHDVLSMHCAANQGSDGSTALFFGLSGTGKTTLSTDGLRKLIGDDEHGWSDEGIFNFEGGCYAKCINLSKEKEPEIYNAITSGALVENTMFFAGTNTVDFSNTSITENTRVSYPLSHIENREPSAMGRIPKNIIFLTCDAFGVLPPVSKLTVQQALYYFLNGYTAKIAGTEQGIEEPKPTFSACFGAPFMPLHPVVYAKKLETKIVKHDVKVWMVNTGWIGGGYGEGHRIPIKTSRAIVKAIVNNELNQVDFVTEAAFGLRVPINCPGVTGDILQPRNLWKDQRAYHKQAQKLTNFFINNYVKISQNSVEAGFEVNISPF
ncbi:phosphoenolpyruvate carboxykinase (ATP) [Niabella aquatica]